MRLYSLNGELNIYLLLSIFACSVHSANILFFHTLVTASHRTNIWPLAAKLADSGHNVTYVFSMSKRVGSHPKIEEIAPKNLLKKVDGFVDFDINMRLNNTINDWLMKVFTKSIEFCEIFYDSPDIKDWLSRPGLYFDLILIDGGFSECGLGLVHKFQSKLIIFNVITRPGHWDAFGVVPESSSIPELLFRQKPMAMDSFWSRMLSTIAPLIWRWNMIKTLRKFEEICREKLNMPDMPSFEELERTASLVLHNTYFIEDYPMSLPPMFVSYSGLLCSEEDRKSRKPLPTRLESFVGDQESNGFIYISFGSAVQASTMPKWLLDEFLTTFKGFSELKFLWRWEGEVPRNAPKNVLFEPWFPQQDILAHQKIKAFVTQAGRPSVQEALCYSVPMIAIPIFADQDFNADRLEHIGAAVSVEIGTLTANKLSDAIKQIVADKRYKDRAKELSKMFKDRPIDPLKNAQWWVDYVLKYNTSLLKPLGMHQYWWQRRLLDVYAFIYSIILFITAITLFVIIKILRFVIPRMKRRSIYKETQSNKLKTN